MTPLRAVPCPHSPLSTASCTASNAASRRRQPKARSPPACFGTRALARWVPSPTLAQEATAGPRIITHPPGIVAQLGQGPRQTNINTNKDPFLAGQVCSRLCHCVDVLAGFLSPGTPDSFFLFLFYTKRQRALGRVPRSRIVPQQRADRVDASQHSPAANPTPAAVKGLKSPDCAPRK